MPEDQTIERDDQAGRFSMSVDGERCVLDFRREDDLVDMTRVLVPDAVGGRGIAGRLTRHALDWARAEGLKVRPTCPYVSAWIERHADYQDLVE